MAWTCFLWKAFILNVGFKPVFFGGEYSRSIFLKLGRNYHKTGSLVKGGRDIAEKSETMPQNRLICAKNVQCLLKSAQKKAKVFKL